MQCLTQIQLYIVIKKKKSLGMFNSFKVTALSYSFVKEQSNMQKQKPVFRQVMQMLESKCRVIFP